ncbi:hypothetical protein [Streptomyces albicerus]|uniref:hypothetical protein n=1 Tax=Streptomyces albicerus TaxID=2569859 RepID=UPI00124BA9FD|nr:hypothetical protein [Streptomyces albicerus]
MPSRCNRVGVAMGGFEVWELHAVTDVMCTSRVISLREELPPRTGALIERAADQRPREPGRPRQGPRVRAGCPLHE